MCNQAVQETARLALGPAILLRFGEFFLEVLLGLFVGFIVIVVIRWSCQYRPGRLIGW